MAKNKRNTDPIKELQRTLRALNSIGSDNWVDRKSSLEMSRTPKAIGLTPAPEVSDDIIDPTSSFIVGAAIETGDFIDTNAPAETQEESQQQPEAIEEEQPEAEQDIAPTTSFDQEEMARDFNPEDPEPSLPEQDIAPMAEFEQEEMAQDFGPEETSEPGPEVVVEPEAMPEDPVEEPLPTEPDATNEWQGFGEFENTEQIVTPSFDQQEIDYLFNREAAPDEPEQVADQDVPDLPTEDAPTEVAIEQPELDDTADFPIDNSDPELGDDIPQPTFADPYNGTYESYEDYGDGQASLGDQATLDYDRPEQDVTGVNGEFTVPDVMPGQYPDTEDPIGETEQALEEDDPEDEGPSYQEDLQDRLQARDERRAKQNKIQIKQDLLSQGFASEDIDKMFADAEKMEPNQIAGQDRKGDAGNAAEAAANSFMEATAELIERIASMIAVHESRLKNAEKILDRLGI